MLALSIRQPWAWLIVNGHKDVENRSWPTKVRGRVHIHASGKLSRNDWHVALDMMDERVWGAHPTILVPPVEALSTGCIIGSVEILDCKHAIKDTTQWKRGLPPDPEWMASPWFWDQYGFHLGGARTHKPIPYKGRLGFFEVPEGVAES
jgi:hypothetical protein